MGRSSENFWKKQRTVEKVVLFPGRNKPTFETVIFHCRSDQSFTPAFGIFKRIDILTIDKSQYLLKFVQ